MIDTRIKEQVKERLKNHAETRNSDKVLFISLVKKYYAVGETIPVERILTLPSFDTISRWRRKIQEAKHYPPTDWTVAKARNWNQAEWKDALGYNTFKPMRMVQDATLF